MMVKVRFRQRWAPIVEGRRLSKSQVKLPNHPLDGFEGKLTSGK
jgi:hypothetical protein